MGDGHGGMGRAASAVGSVLLLLVMAAGTSGCSVFMAAKQEDQKDLRVLQSGTPRAMVLAELGQPVASEVREGRRMDVFSFKQGFHKAEKAARAAGHAVADVFTLGLWEVIGTPTETVWTAQKQVWQVTYDEKECVASANQMKLKSPPPEEPSGGEP